MKPEYLWLLPVSFLLACGMSGCAEAPEPFSNKPRPATKRPETGDWQLPSDAPEPAVAPFDANQAKQHQQSWADYLGLPMETTNSVGMRFVLIPWGEFDMGLTQSEIDQELKITEVSNERTEELVRSNAPPLATVPTQAPGANRSASAPLARLNSVRWHPKRLLR